MSIRRGLNTLLGFSLMIAALVLVPPAPWAEESHQDEGEPVQPPATFFAPRNVGSETMHPDDWSLGAVRLGMDPSEVLQFFGRPTSEGDPVFWHANGHTAINWSYSFLGLDLSVEIGEVAGARWHLGMISAVAPFSGLTVRGVGIGSTRGEVLEAYGPSADEDFTNDERFVAGSIYGGVVFFFDADGRVNRVFIGAAAE